MASSCGGGVLQTLSRAQSGVRRPGTPFHLLPLITCFVFHLVGILHSRCAQLWVSILFSIDASVSVCMRVTLVYGILFQSGFDAFFPLRRLTLPIHKNITASLLIIQDFFHDPIILQYPSRSFVSSPPAPVAFSFQKKSTPEPPKSSH